MNRYRHRRFTDYVVEQRGDKFYCVSNGVTGRENRSYSGLINPGERCYENFIGNSEYIKIDFTTYYKQIYAIQR